jgi:hypothetical protein
MYVCPVAIQTHRLQIVKVCGAQQHQTGRFETYTRELLAHLLYGTTTNGGAGEDVSARRCASHSKLVTSQQRT